MKHQGKIDPTRLVFIDETWTKTNMAPLRGWAPRGERLKASVPHGHWKTMTFLAALRCDRVEAPWLLDGPIDGESFRLYVERVLVPTLRPGDLVVMDNLGSHKSAAVRRAIRAAGARLFLLPKYSPTSTRSRSSSPSSSIASARPPPAPWTPFATPSATSSIPSPQASAATTLSRQAIPRPKLIPL